MTSRERVQAAVNFSGPDKIPFMHCYLPASFKIYDGLEELIQRYPSDIVGDGNIGLDDPLYKKGEFFDHWNCLWTVLHDGLLGQVTGHPLSEDEAIEEYIWPVAANTDISQEVSAVRNKEDKYARVGWITFFEQMINLRGFEKTMIDIIDETPAFFRIHEQILKYNMEMLDRLLMLDADCIAFADDWGSQLNLMISPAQWEKHFLPAYIEMFSKVRSAGKHVFFHTDGYTMPILPALVDAGVNIFWADMTVNPVEELAHKLGGKVCFQGLTDIQFLMLQETPEMVREYAKKLMRLFGDYNGGFIACSEIDPDQPWENVVAIIETFNECGAYPL